MHLKRNLALAALFALFVLPARSLFAANDLDKVLRQLDAAAANFHSTSADFEFDSITTDPIPDTEVQTGTVYYQRDGNAFKMAAHIADVDGKPVPKVVVISKEGVRLYEKLIDQVTTLSKFSKYESWFMLGFGASGKDLESKWNIKYLGSEVIDGVKTDKLELVPKDPGIRKNLPKVTIWIDPARGVSLKQVFDEGEGQSRVCTYHNIRINQSLPADAFTFKTDRNTVYVNH